MLLTIVIALVVTTIVAYGVSSIKKAKNQSSVVEVKEPLASIVEIHEAQPKRELKLKDRSKQDAKPKQKAKKPKQDAKPKQEAKAPKKEQKSKPKNKK